MKRILQAGLILACGLAGLDCQAAQPQRPLQTQSTTTFRFGYIAEKLGVPRLTRPAPRQLIVVPDQSQPTFPILSRLGAKMPFTGSQR